MKNRELKDSAHENCFPITGKGNDSENRAFMGNNQNPIMLLPCGNGMEFTEFLTSRGGVDVTFCKLLKELHLKNGTRLMTRVVRRKNSSENNISDKDMFSSFSD